jgi:hypothetical protein
MYAHGSARNHARQELVERCYDEIAPYMKNMLSLSKEKVVIVDSYG